MSRAGSGTYTLPLGNPVVAGTLITPTWANNSLNDIANALTDSLSRSGLGGMTAPLRGIDGSLGSPSLSFTSEITLGLYRFGAGQVGLAGSLRVTGGNQLNFDSSTGGAVTVSSPTPGRLSFFSGGYRALQVMSGNLVAIGENVPGCNPTLAVGGESTSTFSLLSGLSGAGANFQAQSSATDARLGTMNNLPLLFHTNGAGNERARFDTSGSLLVGHTNNLDPGRISAEPLPSFSPTSGANNWKRAALSGRGGFGGGVALVNTGAGNDGYLLYTTGNPSNLELRYGNNGGTVNGATGVFLSPTATAWASASDERLKDTIEPITGALDKLAALRTVIGKYKTDPADMRRPFLFAQDVQAVLPEAVCRADEAGHLGLAYTDLIPLIIAAINELRA
jgi:hypothetical protein